MGSAVARLPLCAASALILLAACKAPKDAAAPPPPAPAAAPTPAAALPIPTPPIDRSKLLAAIAAASSATAGGEPYPAEAAALAGVRFELRLPFGCTGPAPEAAARYDYDAAKQALKIVVTPQTWTDTEWARRLVASEQTEAIEGFWVRRPWLISETCPSGASSAEASVSPETVGLAQVFEKGGSRLLRRGPRPYEVTEKIDAEQTPARGGFRLVLEGRVATPEDKRPVRCEAAQPDARPMCLVMVEFDRVAFEDPGRRLIAEWRR